ncbi:endo alpha-1,4 polygalactosaminidase [Flavimarina sp. Hel_I_48]|uniref:endo alpha-1,4 polygalactosaminidase n=1 Tax=Flavimarina sp. Hel_I_48 TaxID=1392488 RepID=UPI0013DC5D24|nr:endo alpha-1,4 polygalactosaminidase [Flavimarina sp. Hel_I_48]
MAKSLNSQTLVRQKVLFNYGDFYPEDVAGYDYVILESAHFSSADIAVLKKNNGLVLAYVSLGEVNEGALHYDEIKQYTFGKNKLWDSHFLDIKNEETAAILLDIFELNIVEKNFDGMFLDNIDNYTIHGPTPVRKEALIEFLSKAKIKFPEAHFMQNAGVLILKDTSPYINSLAIESVATDYDFEKSKYKLRKLEQFSSILNELEQAHQDYDLPIILIEYADTKKLYNEVIDRIAYKCWPFFIGSIELQSITEFK